VSARREIELGTHGFGSGLNFIVTKDGVDLGGWYDSFVGIEGRFIPWDEIDKAREFLQTRKPMREWVASTKESGE
jgi:hypothetical protein